jgi:glyceraldehyde-3-phosphate dehydrogenase/erythrose-4-phosphate dehydrogenase
LQRRARFPTFTTGSTKVIGGDLGAVYSWYDNEFGFANTLLAHVVELAAPQPIEETVRR